MASFDILEPHPSDEAAQCDDDDDEAAQCDNDEAAQCDDDVAADFKKMITRAKTYDIDLVNTFEPLSPKSAIKKKENLRKKVFLKCQLHDRGKDWSKENDDCSNCLLFKLSSSLPNGKLPSLQTVLGYLFEQRNIDHKHAESNVILDVMLHWTYCNVYTQSRNTVTKKVKHWYKKYVHLKDYPQKKKKDTYWREYDQFVDACRHLFDIKGSPERIKLQSKIWGVKMTKKDEKFYSNQCLIPPIGYCTSFSDRKWSKSVKRKRQDDENLKTKRIQANQYKDNARPVQLPEIDSDPVNTEEDPCDSEFKPELSHQKYAFKETVDLVGDDMPYKYRHIRHGLRSVRAEYYIAMNQLKSELHMSEHQAQESICTIANTLFGRKQYGEWKCHTPQNGTDCNTLPAKNNTNRTETYAEALVLAGIVNEVMSPDNKTIVTYSNDGSAQNGVGNYTVQSFTINGKQRALPTMPIFTESRETLKELQLMTMKILSAASAYRFSEKDIVEKIDFVITDSTQHNLGVIESVCEELETESTPDSLICHVHPSMMFQSKLKSVFQEIHDAFGDNTLKDCFVTEIDFKHESFIYKAIRCLCSFINRDFSAKPWNRQHHFDVFISPKKNESLSLKDHRFNRVFDCCLHILYHLDDIKLYLDTHSNVLNGIAIIDRGFLDMELLKPILCATALIGIHYTRPYLALLLNTETNYDTLLETFPILYQDFLNTDIDQLLQADRRVVTFINDKKFKSSLPKECLRASVNSCASTYKKEIKKLLGIILPRLADVFSEQRGAIFGFGPKADDSTGTLLKISTTDKETREKLNKTPIHNLNEERSVGFVNYEIHIRGKQCLDSVSRKMVINKSMDILQKADPKPAQHIKEIKMEWNKRLNELQKHAYTEKEKAMQKEESTKYQLLETLKREDMPGPFASDEEVRNYMSRGYNEETKVKRLYNEVRYARMSSMSLKPTAAVFRLKQNHRNLSYQEYADNLTSYLSTARSCRTITIEDLNNVMHGIEGRSQNEVELSDISDTCSSTSQLYEVGEHVIALWYDTSSVKWYLGIIELNDLE